MNAFMGNYRIEKFGITGDKIEDVRRSVEDEVFTFMPDLIYLQVLDNYISRDTSSNVIANDILELTFYLLNRFFPAPKKIVIGCLFPRKKTKGCA